MAEAAVRTLTIPEALYSELQAEAERTKRPAGELAQEAIDRFLSERLRQVDEAIRAYARENAGTRTDLDTELEAASVENLGE